MTTEAKEEPSTLTRQEAVAILSEYHMLGQAITVSQKRRGDLGDAIKRWFAASGETELVDGEIGLIATLQRRHGTPEWDTKSMPDSLVLRLRDLAALKVDGKVMKALSGKVAEVDEIRRYEMPGAETTALIVAEAGK